MEQLYKNHQQYLNSVQLTFRRPIIDEIESSEQLIGLLGPKGVGKTSLLLQYIHEQFDRSTKVLYISMDSLPVKQYSITEIAEYHLAHGGTHLYIDEIHKYPEWSTELKTIYDLYPQLHIVFTGSSILQVYAGSADLSRRALTYKMQGLSFREFLQIETGQVFPVCTLEEILADHITIAGEITKELTILNYFKDYLTYGYFPFYLKNKNTYLRKLENVINNTLEVDMPFILGTSVNNLYKLKKLLHLLATQVPFQPNMTKLSGSLELNKATLSQYIYHLEEAGMLKLLLDAGKGYSHLSKPEKIFLNNTNLGSCITGQEMSSGSRRETFFFNQVGYKHQVNYSAKGDFLIDEKYTIEVGGKGKGFKQIANIENSYIVADELLTGMQNKVPLWLFGFLY